MVYSIKTGVVFWQVWWLRLWWLWRSPCKFDKGLSSLSVLWDLFRLYIPSTRRLLRMCFDEEKGPSVKYFKSVEKLRTDFESLKKKKTDKLDLPGWFPTPVLCHGFLICRRKWKSNCENENEMFENCYLATNRIAKQNTGWVAKATWRKVGCFRRWSSF